MGYEREILESLVKTIELELGDLSGVSMLEFGNQEVYDNYYKVEQLYAEYKYTHTLERRIVKPFFEHLGICCNQIDYNGNDGALQYDVRNDITSLVSKKFQIITNVGFTEHVGEGDIVTNLFKNQYAVFKNIHDLGHVGCIYFHCVPLSYFWYKHGVCDYSLEFFKELCTLNNYSIIKGPYVERYHTEKQVGIFYKKVVDSPFITFEQFASLPGLRSTAND